DLDMLVDREKMNRVLEELVDEPNSRESLLRQCGELADQIRKLPPTVSAEEVSRELNTLICSSMDWAKGQDLELKRSLTRLAIQLDRMRRLKKGGVIAYPNPLASTISDLLVKLKQVGLFLVHVGELEEWLRSENISVSKAKKWAWANAAAEQILSLGAQQGD